MHKASLYETNNYMQQMDATKLLNQYIDELTWSETEIVLDVGCGPGDVTSKLLLPKLPSSVVKVVGLDVSPNMIKHAIFHHTDPKLEFVVANITDPNIDKIVSTKFTKIFSFYCLHWVQDQKQAVKNIYNMLVPGGEILLLLNAFNPIYDQYEKLSRMERWEPYMQDVARFVSPYHHSRDPVAEMTSLLRSTGFHIHSCTSPRSSFTYSNTSALKHAQASVNPFLERIPPEMHEAYMNDSLDIVFNGNLPEVFPHSEEAVTFSYDHIIVFAKK